uniref:Putative secreted protein n=1 Tax=Rhipicephalus microplus TaxID=6941 RepID=A0A6G5A3C4_RHIMP
MLQCHRFVKAIILITKLLYVRVGVGSKYHKIIFMTNLKAKIRFVLKSPEHKIQTFRSDITSKLFCQT